MVADWWQISETVTILAKQIKISYWRHFRQGKKGYAPDVGNQILRIVQTIALSLHTCFKKATGDPVVVRASSLSHQVEGTPADPRIVTTAPEAKRSRYSRGRIVGLVRMSFEE